MRILILGGSGMLGHRLWINLQKNHEVWGTVRGPITSMPDSPKFPKDRIRPDVDARVFDQVNRALAAIQPDILINCVGIIKQMGYIARDPLFSISVNSLFPHQLSLICRTANIRMIHISTDCIFSGTKGNYSESDFSDANDLYGRTKYLGEVSYPHCVTLRTSIIGRELKGKMGLLEWFLAQDGEIEGFRRAIFSGLTTDELSGVISNFVIPNPDISGVFHVSSAPISKFDLLCKIKAAFGKKVLIKPNDDYAIDRSLDSSKFNLVTGYEAPEWDEMVKHLKQGNIFYEKLWKEKQ